MLSLLSTLEEGSEDDDEDDKVSTFSAFVLKGPYSDLQTIFAVHLTIKISGSLCKFVDEKACKESERKGETLAVYFKMVYNHCSVAEKEDISMKMDVLSMEFYHDEVRGVFVRRTSLTEDDGDISHGNPTSQSVVEATMESSKEIPQTGTEIDRGQFACKLEDPSVVVQKIYENGSFIDAFDCASFNDESSSIVFYLVKVDFNEEAHFRMLIQNPVGKDETSWCICSNFLDTFFYESCLHLPKSFKACVCGLQSPMVALVCFSTMIVDNGGKGSLRVVLRQAVRPTKVF